ncbi:hypothetical protein B5M09_002593 [Aphanomyces astaci]|uniref:STIL N-terminal domain-containing protein n=1 Tax=Aphanomyces astaci TaxID=112090 RepID=A0A425DA33_APHAT|nr:hypothetical protein B5M09_002593 [Aphanomyces astaci]
MRQYPRCHVKAPHPEIKTRAWVCPVGHTSARLSFPRRNRFCGTGSFHAPCLLLAPTTTTNLRVSSELLTAYLSVQLVVSDITSTSVTVQASALGPQTSSLTLTPIRNLPLLLTPLAKLLMKPRAVSPSWWGYVTLDKTRKVVPLLQTDPLCASRPLVGVWVRSLSLSHMYLASMLFGTTSSRQTLWIAPRTFLLVKYPMQSTQWLPEFYECTIVADKALLGFFTSSQTAACDRAVEICMERRVFPATLPTSSLTCEDQVSTQENVVNTSVPPVVNSYRPEPPRNDTMSSFDMPTPMPERAPPIPPPQTKPILPLPPPPPGDIDDQPSGGSGGRNDVDLAALVHHQSRVMDAMQCEIQSLQRQLKAAMAPKTEKAEVGTNTSFAGETNALDCTTSWKGNDSDLDDDDDLDDRYMMTPPPLVVQPAASQPPPSSPSPSTSSPLAGGADFSFDVPRIQVPSAASTMDGQSDDDDDDDIAQIEARYLGKVKRAPLTT